MKEPIRSGYAAEYHDLVPEHPLLGKVSLLPWDTQTFGTPVGVYRTATDELDQSSRRVLSERFLSWTVQNEVTLCSCAVPPGSRFWKSFLPELEFRFVDFGLSASLNGLQRAKLPRDRTPLRVAETADCEGIGAIAAESFFHGRYHADPHFPRELADLRYRHWISRALASHSEREKVFVLGESNSIKGFYHVVIDGDTTDLRLVAISKEFQRSGLGFSLCASTLHALQERGVNRVSTSISAGNTGVLNVYSALGFMFSRPEAIYHWHNKQTNAAIPIPFAG
ncbi:MAG: GNAT family N-acetyltransferase [Bryobacteraceae bacterium]